MTRTAQRASSFTESVIREMSRVANQYGAINLAQGFPDFAMPDPMKDAACAAIHGDINQYAVTWGSPALRLAIAEKYRRWYDMDVDPDREITVTCGATEAMAAVFLALINPGDEVIIFEPFYTNYATMALVAGVGVKPIPCDGRTGYHLPPIEAVERAIAAKTRGILLCAPSNPTGTAYTATEVDAIVDLAIKHDLWIITDEAYREFIYDGARHESPMTRARALERVVLVDSISKRLNMCGARVGALVSKNAGVRDACLKFAQARLSPPTLGQWAAAVIHEVPQSYTDGVVAEFRKRRDLVLDGLSKIPGAFARKPEGAFYLMAELPVPDAEEFVIWMLKEYRKDGATVMVAPGDGFYATPGRGKNEIRFAYVLEEGALRKAMEILKGALEAYPVKVAR